MFKSLTLLDSKNILLYYHIKPQPSIKKIKEKAIKLFINKICNYNKIFKPIYSCILNSRNYKNRNISRKNRLVFQMV
jgi:hypothetical protein